MSTESSRERKDFAETSKGIPLSPLEWGIIGILVSTLVVLGSLDILGPSGGTQAVIVLPRFALLNSPVAIAIALTSFWTICIVAGNREWRNHLARLESIPIRIHVNGSRGKTGTSRLIGAALRANGLRVVTKTTGKMPAIIDIWGNERIIRVVESGGFPEGNIREQKDVVKFATKQHAQALVVECMALAPESQSVSEEKLIRATIGVITNVRHDHLDVIGPDLVSATRYLCRMIPRGQVVVTCEEKLLPTIREEAAKRSAAVVSADPSTVPDSIIEAFPYITFKENLAIALKVSQLLGLDKDKSLEGMLESKPDFGTVRILNRQSPSGRYVVVIAFGVNDVDSLGNMIEELARRLRIRRGPFIGLFNSREDRAQRSAEFGTSMGGKIAFKKIIVTGQYVGAFTRSADKIGYPKDNLIALERGTPQEVLKILDEITPNDGVVIATGNMVTSFGYGFIGLLEEVQPAWSSQLSIVPS